jgi:hypothetical protein
MCPAWIRVCRPAVTAGPTDVVTVICLLPGKKQLVRGRRQHMRLSGVRATQNTRLVKKCPAGRKSYGNYKKDRSVLYCCI